MPGIVVPVTPFSAAVQTAAFAPVYGAEQVAALPPTGAARMTLAMRFWIVPVFE